MAKPQETDEKLIEGCLRNDSRCQQQLYLKYADKMYAVCLRYSHNPETAKDLLQEGFIRVFRYLGEFRFSGSFEGWIRRIMVNTAIENYRREIRMPLTDLEDQPLPSTENHVMSNIGLKELMNMVMALPAGYRTVFNLFAIEGYSHREIAEMLEISENTSKTQYMKARLMLQKMLGENNTAKG